MWRTVIIVGCCVGAVISTPVGVKDIPMVNDEMFNEKTEMAMSTLNLPSNATSIRADITDGFSCDGRLYGYYADIDNDCQIFHVCLPVTYPDGKENTFRWSFICPEETVFSQESFTCVRSLDMGFDCAESMRFYDLNRNFGMASDMEGEMLRVSSDETKKEEIETKPTIPTTTAAPVSAKRRPGDYSVRRQPTKAAVTAAPPTSAVRSKPTRFATKTPNTPAEIKPILNKNEFIKNHLGNGLRRTPVRPVTVKDEVKPVVEVVDEQVPIIEEEVKKIVVDAAETTPVEVKPEIEETKPIESANPVEVQPIKTLEIPVMEMPTKEILLAEEKPTEALPMEIADDMTKLSAPQVQSEINIRIDSPIETPIDTEDNTKTSMLQSVDQEEKKEESPAMDTNVASVAAESEIDKSPADVAVENKIQEQMSAMPEVMLSDTDSLDSQLNDNTTPLEADLLEHIAQIEEKPIENTRTEEKTVATPVEEVKPLEVRGKPEPEMLNDQATLSSTVQEMQSEMMIEHSMPIIPSPQNGHVPNNNEAGSHEIVVPAIIQDPVVSHVLKADSDMPEIPKPAQGTLLMEEMPAKIEEPTAVQPAMDEQMPEMPKTEEIVQEPAQNPELVKNEEIITEPIQETMKTDLPVGGTEKQPLELPTHTAAGNSEMMSPGKTQEQLHNSVEELKLPTEEPKPSMDMQNYETLLKQDANEQEKLEAIKEESFVPEPVLKTEQELLNEEPLKVDSDVLKFDSMPEASVELKDKLEMKPASEPAMQLNKQETLSVEIPVENPAMNEESDSMLKETAAEQERPISEVEKISPPENLTSEPPAAEMNSEEQKSEIIKTISSLISQATMDSSIQPTLPIEPTLQSDEMLSGSPPQIEQVAHEAPMILVESPAPLADLNDLMETPALLDDHKKTENLLQIPVQIIFGEEPVQQTALPYLKNHLEEHLEPAPLHVTPINTPIKIAVSDPVIVQNPAAEEVLVKSFETPAPEKEVTQIMLETSPVEMKDAIGEVEPVELKSEILPVVDEKEKIFENLRSQANVEEADTMKSDSVPELSPDTTLMSTIDSNPSIFEQIVGLASNLVKAETISASAEDQPVVHDLTEASAKVDEDNDSAATTFSKRAPTNDGLSGIQVAHDDLPKEAATTAQIVATSEPIEEIEANNDLVNSILRMVAAEKIGEMVERTKLAGESANRIDMARSLHAKKIDPRKRRFLFKSSTNSR